MSWPPPGGCLLATTPVGIQAVLAEQSDTWRLEIELLISMTHGFWWAALQSGCGPGGCWVACSVPGLPGGFPDSVC